MPNSSFPRVSFPFMLRGCPINHMKHPLTATEAYNVYLWSWNRCILSGVDGWWFVPLLHVYLTQYTAHVCWIDQSHLWVVHSLRNHCKSFEEQPGRLPWYYLVVLNSMRLKMTLIVIKVEICKGGGGSA